jgi:pyruvate dehydrogenase E1 component alpha subunit
MLRIRMFEEAAVAAAHAGKIMGSLHTSVGQEASIVGACMALAKNDYMVGTHRSHGHPIGKGARLGPLFAELLGRAGGINQGKGGSMHLSDFSVGSLGETSIVGSGLPVAAGAALGAKMLRNGRVALCFFGDGASNEGTFHESLNLAAIWTLPVVYVCENNGYGELTAASRAVSVPDIATRSVAYGLPGAVVDGQDVLAVHAVVSEAVNRARNGDGATLIETKTYRYHNHSHRLPIDHYRTREEIAKWQERDPITLFREYLAHELVLDEAAANAIVDEVTREVTTAAEFAEASQFPAPEEAFTHLYSNPIAIAR